MKTIIIFAAFLAVAFAFPHKRQAGEEEKQVVMLRHTPSNYVGSDNYKFGYELSDGQMRDESAQIEMQGPEKSVIRVRGSYAWYNPENGMTYQIDYIADENGFQPQGAHLPVAPAAPAVPVVSIVPAAPVAPVVPAAPVAPVESVAPVEQIAPVESVAPVEQIVPVESVAPVEQIAPVEPIAPIEQIAPVEPIAPIEQIAPVEPVA